MKELATDLVDYLAQLDAADDRACQLTTSLTEAQAGWRPGAGAGWSIAQCLEHTAITNGVYLQNIREAAVRARPGHVALQTGGWFSQFFLKKSEPPPSLKIKAPRKIQPRPTLPLCEALAEFLASNADVRSFVNETADRNLCATRFRNPFMPGLNFTIASGLLIIAAHNRRHLWQAERVRMAGDFPA